MSIPDEDDEEFLTAALIGTEPSTVRSIAYRICAGNHRLSPSEFLVRLAKALEPLAGGPCDVPIRDIWMKSVQAARLTPGAHDVLGALRGRCSKLALVSNTTPVSWLILDRLGLRPYFRSIVFSCDVGYLKPDPRIFQEAISCLGARRGPSTCVVGDKIRTDILGGRILGLSSILLETRATSTMVDERLPVDAIISDLRDLLPLLGIKS